jgi:hypothetical protein
MTHEARNICGTASQPKYEYYDHLLYNDLDSIDPFLSLSLFYWLKIGWLIIDLSVTFNMYNSGIYVQCIDHAHFSIVNVLRMYRSNPIIALSVCSDSYCSLLNPISPHTFIMSHDYCSDYKQRLGLPFASYPPHSRLTFEKIFKNLKRMKQFDRGIINVWISYAIVSRQKDLHLQQFLGVELLDSFRVVQVIYLQWLCNLLTFELVCS